LRSRGCELWIDHEVFALSVQGSALSLPSTGKHELFPLWQRIIFAIFAVLIAALGSPRRQYARC
jgi:hypothetical protein